MTCQVLLEFKAKEGCIEKIRAWFREVLPDTRAFDGCVALHLVQNQDNPNTIVAVEQWVSRQHYEKYLQWRTQRGEVADFLAMLDGEPTFRFFDYFGV